MDSFDHYFITIDDIVLIYIIILYYRDPKHLNNTICCSLFPTGDGGVMEEVSQHHTLHLELPVCHD